ncbi:MAG: CARDB domain-containing protein [Acidobacteriota bacterium]
MRAEAEWSQTYQKNIANPTVWRAFFVAGYLPVYITFQLPTHIGLEVGTTAVAQTELELGFGGTFSFDFRCNPGGCTGGQSQDFRFHNLDSIPDVATGSVEVDVNAKPFLDSRLQVNLYHERVFHLEAGLRAGIQNRLWGYAGTQCGDADGDGQNELVHGALLDIYGDLDVPWGYGGIFGSQENFEDLWRIPLYTKDLLDAGIPNNALVPVLTGPTSTNQLEPTTYEMWMRPCYPLTDSPMLTAGISGVNMPTYYIDPQAHSPGGDPISFEATWDQGGQGHIRAQVVSDSPLGRNLRNNFHESRLDVWVEPAGPGPQTGSSPGVCVPSCPPIEITSSEILNQPYRGDLSAARLELCDRFGWNLDVDDYPPNLIPLFGYTIEYFHTTSSINPLHAEEHYFGEYISNYASLQEFCLVNNVHQRGFRLDNVWDLYRWQVKKACVTLDPDVDREISPGSMAATVCFLPDRGPFVILRPIVLQAQWIAGTNDIYLTWNDDSTRSTNDNDFTLFRREDDGAFQEIASGIEDLQYLDEELTPGTYTYRILSHGETYDSNTVEILGPNFEMNWQVIERAPTLLIVRHSNPYPGTEVSWRHEYRVNGGVWRGATSFTSQVIRQSLPRNLGDLQVQFRAARSSSGPSYDWHNSPVYTVENFDFGLGVTCHDAVYTATWNPSLAVDLWENGEVYGWISGVTPPFSGRLTTSARPTFRLRLHDDPSVESNRVSLDGCEWRPPAPAVTASSNLSTHVRLEWTSLPTGWPPSEWRIFRSDSPSVDPDNGAARIADVGTDVRTYDDYGAPTDQVLYYWVQAVVGSREGWPGQASGYRPEIYSSTLPDLTPRLRWIDPSGSHGILVQHEVENQGTAAVSGYSLRVALSTDPILSADDYRGEIETQDLPLLAFETRHVYSSLSVPQSYRNRPIWVFVEVDPHDSIEEADELNNTSPLFPPIVVFDLPF